MGNKRDKLMKKLSGNYKSEEKVGIIDKLKMTWYLDTAFSKWMYILSFLALLFVVIRLIAGRGLW